jgi:uncharacterized protein
MLTPAMKQLIADHPLGFVATVSSDGAPNLSPKGTFFIIDDTTIGFGDIRSPGTISNLSTNDRIAVNFIDPFTRKGFRMAGHATVIARENDRFAALLAHFTGSLGARFRSIVAITVTKALPVTSPAYDDGAQESDIRRSWTTRFRRQQPGEQFKE